jgi:elongation of very long chain fatty acids protein 7
MTAQSSNGNSDGFFDAFSWDKRDVRLDDFPMMSSIWPTICVCLMFLFLAMWAGPAYMKNRQPYDVTHIMRCYYALQLLFLLYIVIVSVMTVSYWEKGYNWCE